MSMLAIRLPDGIQKRLAHLAQVTGRTKTFYVREAIVEHLDDLEDEYLANYRLKHPAKRMSHAEVEKELGLDN